MMYGPILKMPGAVLLVERKLGGFRRQGACRPRCGSTPGRRAARGCARGGQRQLALPCVQKGEGFEAAQTVNVDFKEGLFQPRSSTGWRRNSIAKSQDSVPGGTGFCTV